MIHNSKGGRGDASRNEAEARYDADRAGESSRRLAGDDLPMGDWRLRNAATQDPPARAGAPALHSEEAPPVGRYNLSRFHALYTRGEGCWEWTGNRLARPDGSLSYGRYGKPAILAHRLAYIVANGSIPDEVVVRHRCDNVACVRPDHLEIGSQADNLRDMRERGRAHLNTFPTGTAHPNAKVNEAVVRSIRRLRAQGLSLAAIAQRHDLNPSTVHDIVRRKTWRDVE